MKRLQYAVFAATLLALFAACRGDLSTSIWAARAGTGPVQAVGQIGLPDGVFPGVGTGGFYGDVYVDVTIHNNAIAAVVVTGHSETPAFAGSAFTHVIGAMMLTQATGVDTVAGATLTSQALINAVEDALVSGGADLAAIRLGRPPLSFTAGTFSGVGTGGFGGDVYVDVTFSEDAILAITVTAHSETPAFATSVFNQLTPAILSGQSAAVDAVSGATMTADAFLGAVRDAVRQAGGQ
ncbi:MAG: FMN-binding protein [Treponema sp.]|nr:FMN-binding protein [Treponema sp.]